MAFYVPARFSSFLNNEQPTSARRGENNNNNNNNNRLGPASCQKTPRSKGIYIHELETKIEALTKRLRLATGSDQSSKTLSSLWTPLHDPSILYPEFSPKSASNEQQGTPSDAFEEEEISEVNRHTNAIEFHGNTSSAAALGHLQRACEPLQNIAKETYTSFDQHAANPKPQDSLISTLHNPNFSLFQLHVTHDKEKRTAHTKDGYRDNNNSSSNDGINADTMFRPRFARMNLRLTNLVKCQYTQLHCRDYKLTRQYHDRELSFSLGRPDTLGLDEYHNRCQPSRDGHSEYTIIPIVVDLAHIIRLVSIDIYHSRIPIQQKMKHSLKIEQKLDTWLNGLPKILQPDFGQPGGNTYTSISALRDPKWSRRQRLVLGIRVGGDNRTDEAQRLLEIAAKKCLDSARKTVEVIYETFRQYTFFRCWWYNTTYIMFAVTNILLPLSRRSSSFLNIQETNLLIESINKSIEILEAMEESVVATESVAIVKTHLREYCHGSNQPSQEAGHSIINAAAGTLQKDASNDTALADLGELQFDDFIPVRVFLLLVT
ncbi:hypothetical protein UA08_05641 [Talaromyces atroroseus]|uniref:Transcription factor domain-containing protein n=1 Tax=Talaromyces atroroseus TaxID=1441469 RepID=A0A225ANR9_TALAT|nr:hypothetical protein UA08_05641 [Talaromyces atroroseus]OKL58938.1 hypothetical protein UA08_05641 [Talaromyces atroroseus]